MLARKDPLTEFRGMAWGIVCGLALWLPIFAVVFWRWTR